MNTIQGKNARHCIQCKTRFYVGEGDDRKDFCCKGHFDMWFRNRNIKHNKDIGSDYEFEGNYNTIIYEKPTEAPIQ